MYSTIVRLDILYLQRYLRVNNPPLATKCMALIITDETLVCLLDWIRIITNMCQLSNFKGLYLSDFYIRNVWENLKAP